MRFCPAGIWRLDMNWMDRLGCLALALSAVLAGPALAQAPAPHQATPQEQAIPQGKKTPQEPGNAQEKDKPRVVASFSILADLARQVGGDRIEVVTLVGPDGDAHVFQPSAQDAKRVAGASLVLVNGLGLEGWIDRLSTSAAAKAPVVVVSRDVKPIREGHPAGAAHRGHDHGGIDPHAWQDVANVKLYVAAIAAALGTVDPAGRALYDANAVTYQASLDALDAEIRAAIAALPRDRRKIVTTHDAFAYFAKAYGVAFVAPQGVSTDTEASARDVARIIRQIKAQAIPAVFLENVSDPRLMARIAAETGARIGGRLYSDALSAPDGTAGTYIDMMRSNIRELSAALSS
jgi:zinc/manganese transport system substrate-binding protein